MFGASAESIPDRLLDASVSYVGAFALPAKENPTNKWIYIKSSFLAKLPAGKQVSNLTTTKLLRMVAPDKFNFD